MPNRLRKKRPHRVDATSMYDVAGASHYCGISRDEIRKGRQAGLLTAYERGHRVFYEGADLIKLIKSKPKHK